MFNNEHRMLPIIPTCQEKIAKQQAAMMQKLSQIHRGAETYVALSLKGLNNFYLTKFACRVVLKTVKIVVQEIGIRWQHWGCEEGDG